MSPGPRPALATLTAKLKPGKDAAHRIGHHARDMFSPLLHLGRGFSRQIAWARAWWKNAPTDKRKTAAIGGGACALALFFLPYAPVIAVILAVGSAAWLGRDTSPPPPPAPEPTDGRLETLYNALVPHLGDDHDPTGLFTPGGDYKKAFANWTFDGDRLTHLELSYSPYFTDDDPQTRNRLERVIETKTGRTRQYHYDWDTEHNHLAVTALPDLPPPVPAQPYITAPREIVLGFTDDTHTSRTIPVHIGGETRQLPPVVWRAGNHSTDPHLLAVAEAASGKSTLLRTIAVQALRDGDLLVVDGPGSGDHAYLAGRPGVLRVDSGYQPAVETLTWLRDETQRRITAITHAKQTGAPVPDDARRPLWVLLDEITELTDHAAAHELPDPQELLDLPLRLGRTANISIVATSRPGHLDRIRHTLFTQTRARVALGPLNAEITEYVLGTTPGISGGEHMPPGRGYARIGHGPVLRIQVPHTPDPLEDDTDEADRLRLLDLLPRTGTSDEAPVSFAK